MGLQLLDAQVDGILSDGTAEEEGPPGASENPLATKVVNKEPSHPWGTAEKVPLSDTRTRRGGPPLTAPSHPYFPCVTDGA